MCDKGLLYSVVSHGLGKTQQVMATSVTLRFTELDHVILRKQTAFNHSLGGTFFWVMRREHPSSLSLCFIWILGPWILAPQEDFPVSSLL